MANKKQKEEIEEEIEDDELEYELTEQELDYRLGVADKIMESFSAIDWCARDDKDYIVVVRNVVPVPVDDLSWTLMIEVVPKFTYSLSSEMSYITEFLSLFLPLNAIEFRHLNS